MGCGAASVIERQGGGRKEVSRIVRYTALARICRLGERDKKGLKAGEATKSKKGQEGGETRR